MGQEIQSRQFDKHDFSRFRQRLKEETELLGEYFRKGNFSATTPKCGFEIEACLVDQNFKPAAKNAEYIKRLNNPLVVPELAAFNVELNSSPQLLHGQALDLMQRELESNLKACREIAGAMDIHLIMIGILPTIRQTDLCMANISDMKRYHVLNEEVLKLRNGRPMYLHIQGRDSLAVAHNDVMLEAATTSFQVHQQVEPALSDRYFNASMIASAPVVAACGNSPYLFGKQLWQETRIPLFEQAVELGNPDKRRVTFGSGYVKGSVLECFEENCDAYPILIPANSDDDPGRFSHVRFHNGTIWRWNRPLIGINADGSVHIRIEHRVIPAGPSALDSIANAALYYGYCAYLINLSRPPELELEFAAARDNFYRCAQYGLDTEIAWFNGSRIEVTKLLLESVIPAAREGLGRLGIDMDSGNKFIDVIENRVNCGQTGAVWQSSFVRTNAADMPMMCHAYLENQNRGTPVHEWNVKC